MRLRLTIIRHGLPATRILWTVASSSPSSSSAAAAHIQGGYGSHSVPASAVASTRVPNVSYGDEGCTIAQLLEDLNEVVPLETAVNGDAGTAGESDEFGGQWGLEDYVVEVDGFECLHFMHVDGLLRDGDEVVIRSLGLGDLRARRLAGRMQVSTDGRRLIDGVPFGRHFLQRSYSARPPIRIPPRKRRRTMNASGWPGNLQYEDDADNGISLNHNAGSVIHNEPLHLWDEGSQMSSQQGTIIKHPRPPPNLFDLHDDDMYYESETDMDYQEDGDEEELADELTHLREDAERDIPAQTVSTRSSGRKSRLAQHDLLPTSSPARLSTMTTSITTGKCIDIEATPKSAKSVHFEARNPTSLHQLSEQEDTPEANEESSPGSNSSMSSTDDESSEAPSEEEYVSAVSASESESSDADSDSESDDDSLTSEEGNDEVESDTKSIAEKRPSPKNPKAIDVWTPPGHGSRKTRNSNRRKKLRLRLQKLKSLGKLPPEANFDDLKEWEGKHGKQPLTEVVDLEEKPNAKAKEQSDIEIKRQQLLRDLAAGGIDVDGCSEKENIPPRYRNGRQNGEGVSKSVQEEGEKEEALSQTEATGEDESMSPTAMKRRKLDLSSTKRLLFGSLGVRTPKSKMDEEALRNKLAGPRDNYLPKPTETVAAEEEPEDAIDENWQNKIILSATECVFDDIQLATPPFPFKQRWDADASYEIRQRRNNGKRNRKRKNRDWQEEADASWYENAEDTTLNYDDAYSTIPQEDQTDKNVSGNVPDDLPQLPMNLNSLPALTKDETKSGTIIAFKQLDMSKATNWQPQVSEYKVAVVDDLLENGSLNIVLSKRDREARQEVEVDENGIRTYSGLEMPEDEEEGEDDGFRNFLFTDLLEPKILQPASVQERYGGEQVNGDFNQSSLASSLHLPPAPLPSIPLSVRNSNDAPAENPVDATSPGILLPPAAVSLQRRLEVSPVIHDAGFQYAAASDLGFSMPMSVVKNTVPPEDSDIEPESEASFPAAAAADDKDSSRDEKFSSSPPAAMPEEECYDSNVQGDARNKAHDVAMADMDDSGFQMNVEYGDDDDDEVGMNDGISLGAGRGSSNDDFSLNSGISFAKSDSDAEVLAGKEVGQPEKPTSAPHEVSTFLEEVSEYLSLPSQTSQAEGREQCVNTGTAQNNATRTSSVTNAQDRKLKIAKTEDKSFPSTTLRSDGNSHLQDSFVTASTSAIDYKPDNYSSDYSDAGSTVRNPFYERDKLAREEREREVAAATEKRKGKARVVDEEKTEEDARLTLRKYPIPIDAASSFDHSNFGNKQIHNGKEQVMQSIQESGPTSLEQDDNGSDSSEFDFPSSEVLWAAVPPSQKSLPPIETNEERQFSARLGEGHPAASSSLPSRRESDKRRKRRSTSRRSSSPSFEPVPSSTTRVTVRSRVPRRRISSSSSSTRNLEHKRANLQIERGSSTSIPDFEPESQQQLSINSHQGVQEEASVPIGREDHEDSSHPPATTITIDLTLSSPLVSPVNDGSDEDFARSKGLPRGPGWVKKNVPPTQRQTRRQTRSFTGGTSMLSSSPVLPQRTRRGRRPSD